ncbi:hypothetical protein CEXT_463181 [Caerostris extrusa]|uniref:Uncharacterized protein n=1 Tax=Caerostris extrusa TaxID=172846 RepID=A0AAV4SBJ2_CAEEX|nr:hypothetical protein CEXT_463181 [Caerostris extrusa]
MATKTVWSPACRRRRWCKSTDEATTSDEDFLSDAGIDVDDDEPPEVNDMCDDDKRGKGGGGVRFNNEK